MWRWRGDSVRSGSDMRGDYFAGRILQPQDRSKLFPSTVTEGVLIRPFCAIYGRVSALAAMADLRFAAWLL